jgi:hypothetical protein
LGYLDCLVLKTFQQNLISFDLTSHWENRTFAPLLKKWWITGHSGPNAESSPKKIPHSSF